MNSQPEEKRISDYQENFILYGMPEDEWIDGWVNNFDDEDDNTGGIAPIPRPKQPKPSPKTNGSQALPD